MIEKALARFNIDPSSSFFVGDMERDIAAADAAGVRGIKIEPNTGLQPLLDNL
jgi:D-glycero-D-manno-heptose 1,7-bisphosphate phosphatase